MASGWLIVEADRLEPKRRWTAQGNRMISVSRTDIIIYGDNLWNYFNQDFKTRLPAPVGVPRPSIPLWMDLVGYPGQG
jgi:hypothetical protein